MTKINEHQRKIIERALDNIGYGMIDLLNVLEQCDGTDIDYNDLKTKLLILSQNQIMVLSDYERILLGSTGVDTKSISEIIKNQIWLEIKQIDGRRN